MEKPQVSGVSSNTNPHSNPQTTDTNMVSRPYKIQKIQIPSSNQIGLFTNYQPHQPHGEGSSEYHHQQFPSQEELAPAQDQQEEDTNDPFFYYEDTHVQDSINQCSHSVLGKILAEKSIPTQVLFNSLAGIWCNPTGFKITELEGKIL
jgi:hypothetical protein